MTRTEEFMVSGLTSQSYVTLLVETIILLIESLWVSKFREFSFAE